jgi:GxxExxY protein
MTENEISKVVVELCIKLYRQYGPGLFESVYEELFCYELSKSDIAFKRQHAIQLVHEDVKLGTAFRIDVVIEDKVVIELKSVETLADVHYKQVHTYFEIDGM